MNYLLDTCVISELVKPKANPKVIEWIRNCHEQNLFLSSLTIGEIKKGISKLSESKKKRNLMYWLENDLLERFNQRILAIDVSVAMAWGDMLSACEKKGIQIPVTDGLIASTAMVHGMTVVTRNIEDIEPTGVAVHNPWK